MQRDFNFKAISYHSISLFLLLVFCQNYLTAIISVIFVFLMNASIVTIMYAWGIEMGEFSSYFNILQVVPALMQVCQLSVFYSD